MSEKEKELFYENDVREHQQHVTASLITCANFLLDRGMGHDVSKLDELEKKHYVEPVWDLNNSDIEYGSDEYKEQVKKMGEGWKHHIKYNDHHPEYHGMEDADESNNAISKMNLFQLLEMLCDWIAAAARKKNEPSRAMDFLVEKFYVNQQLQQILLNTLDVIVNGEDL